MINTERAQGLAESIIDKMKADGFTYDEFLQVHNYLGAVEFRARQNYGHQERAEIEAREHEVRARYDAMPFLAFDHPHPADCPLVSCRMKASLPPLKPEAAAGILKTADVLTDSVDACDGGVAPLVDDGCAGGADNLAAVLGDGYANAVATGSAADVQDLHVSEVDSVDFHLDSSVEGDLPVARQADSPSAEGATPPAGLA